jgi:hypothetical protein
MRTCFELRCRVLTCLLLTAMVALAPAAKANSLHAAVLAAEFARDVGRRLDPPEAEQSAYALRLEEMLAAAGIVAPDPQYFILVDRAPNVQAAFIYLREGPGVSHFVGASPVSTGRPGTFDHFLTPVGAFAHTLENPDFRAEGTRNELGILGYGAKGLRVFDFGWATSQRGWGKRGDGQMRLQMHATDPVLLEPRLGVWHSKGCIRVPAALNRFVDLNGLLDADYDAMEQEGAHFWVLRPDRIRNPWAGRWLIVVDSQRAIRPAWSPAISHSY